MQLANEKLKTFNKNETLILVHDKIENLSLSVRISCVLESF